MSEAVVELARVWVPPYVRVVNGKKQHVDGYWREYHWDEKAFTAGYRAWQRQMDADLTKGDKVRLAEWDAHELYTGSGYERINRGLRTGRKFDKQDRELIESLDRLIGRERTTEPMVVWRDGGPPGRLGPGDTFTDLAFGSTTTDPKMQDSFGSMGASIFEIHLPAGTPFTYGTFGEREYILPRGVTYRVQRVDPPFDPRKHGSALYGPRFVLEAVPPSEVVKFTKVFVPGHPRATEHGVIWVDSYWREGNPPAHDDPERGWVEARKEQGTSSGAVDQVARALSDRYGDWNASLKEGPVPNANSRLNDYMAGAYMAVNRKLRDPSFDPRSLKDPFKANPEYIDRVIASIRESLDAAPELDRPLIVWRGGGVEPDLKIGDTFTDPAFVSTSLSPRTAASFAGEDPNPIEIRLPPGTKGGYLGTIETEFLIQAGTTFRVVGTPETTGDQWVLEAVPEAPFEQGTPPSWDELESRDVWSMSSAELAELGSFFDVEQDMGAATAGGSLVGYLRGTRGKDQRIALKASTWDADNPEGRRYLVAHELGHTIDGPMLTDPQVQAALKPFEVGTRSGVPVYEEANYPGRQPDMFSRPSNEFTADRVADVLTGTERKDDAGNIDPRFAPFYDAIRRYLVEVGILEEPSPEAVFSQPNIPQSSVVELSQQPLAVLALQAQDQRQTLLSITAQYPLDAAQSFTNAFTEAIDYFDLIESSNYPRVPSNQLITRPDIQEAFRIPFFEAADRATQATNSAWDVARTQGHSDASQELQALGIEAPSSMPDIDGSPRSALIRDLRSKVQESHDRLTEAVQASPDQKSPLYESARADVSRRASYGPQTAAAHAYAAQKEATYAAATSGDSTVRKLWITRFGPGTCRTCAALHGMMRPLGKPFPAKAHMGPGTPPRVWGPGGMGHPPRHPNCRCMIVLVTQAHTDTSTDVIASFRDWALAWMQRLLSAVLSRSAPSGHTRGAVPTNPQEPLGYRPSIVQPSPTPPLAVPLAPPSGRAVPPDPSPEPAVLSSGSQEAR